MKKKHKIRPIRVSISRYCFFVVLVFSLARGGSVAQAQEPVPFEYRPFDEEQIENLRNQEEFDYEVENYTRLPFWESFLQMLRDWLKAIFGAAPGSDTLQVVFYIISGLLLLWAIIRLAGVDSGLGFKPSQSEPKLPYDLREEDLQQIDFTAEMEKARQNQNWRLMIRINYLYALRLLSDAGKLKVRAGKTNHDYLYEIDQPGIKDIFSRLSYIFEYTWYGHFEPDERVRQAAENHTSDLHKILSQK